MEDPVVPLERNLHSPPSGRTIRKKVSRESFVKIRLGKSSELGMLICQPSKWTILMRVCGRRKTGNVESTNERSRFGRTNILP